MIVYGLIGYPLTHSFSAKYFEEKFRKENIVGTEYRLFSLPTLGELSEILKIPGLSGLNVTIPYKQSVMSWVDEVDEDAAETGAVNTITIRNKNGKRWLKGYNTDTGGFLRSADFTGHQQALILGTGGGSLAVQQALRKLGIGFTLVSRRVQPFRHLLYTDLNEKIMNDHSLIINATPLGMFPRTETFPEIPYEYLTGKHFLYDLVYNPEATVFMKKGQEKGAKAMNGLKMLHLQAENAWSIWNNS